MQTDTYVIKLVKAITSHESKNDSKADNQRQTTFTSLTNWRMLQNIILCCVWRSSTKPLCKLKQYWPRFKNMASTMCIPNS